MKIALLNTKETPRARYIMDCFTVGANVNGDECVWIQDDASMHLLDGANVAVQICMVNQHRSCDPINDFRVRAWDRTRALGLRTLVIDTGFISNQYDYAAYQRSNKNMPHFDMGSPATFPSVDRRIYYELAYDGIKGFGDHCTTVMPADRWTALHRVAKPWRVSGEYVLLMTQPLHGQSSQGTNVFEWYGKTVRELRKITKLPLLVRIHPRVDKFKTSLKHTRAYQHNIEKHIAGKMRWSNNIRLEDDLVNARLAIAYSTSAAVTAVLEGVPVYVGSRNCVAWAVADQNLTLAFNRPRRVNREPWLHALAYSQWNTAEMKNGAAWAHYRACASKGA